jgi:hypothetical protein
MSVCANSGHQIWPALCSAKQHRQLRDIHRNPPRIIGCSSTDQTAGRQRSVIEELRYKGYRHIVQLAE